MRYRRVFLLCSVCIICVAGLVPHAHAQSKDEAFDPSLSLEQTVAWLGQQLTHVASVASSDGKYVRRLETRLVKAKECTLSYSITTESESRVAAEASISQVREIWTLDLSGLDPASVNVVGTPGVEQRVWFRAAPGSRNAIRTSRLQNQLYSTTISNRAFGHFSVRDEKLLAKTAAGLSHAVHLCRQSKQ
jgi:hypothetical protein